MFAPAPAAGVEAASRTAGRRMFPSTRPDEAAGERDGEAPGGEGDERERVARSRGKATKPALAGRC